MSKFAQPRVLSANLLAQQDGYHCHLSLIVALIDNALRVAFPPHMTTESSQDRAELC